jgi:prepilin-type N-terminal cleavage/methylation domain-containing protein
MIKLSKSAGFSLVELMIVVAIMAILAAIAIPSFLRFSMRAKTAEATSNLAAIRTAQESYRAEEDTYLACAADPALWAAGAGASTPIAWDAGTAFETIGFEPDGNVRYQYAVVAAGAGITVAFSASATGDIDEDAAVATFTVDKTAATYPKAVKGGDDF